MQRVLPPGMPATAFDRGMVALRSVVGAEWVLDTDEDRDTYLDPYATGDARAHAPAGAVAPANLEQVQAVMRVANAHKLPLWPISRGKNFGYGGAAPRLPGSLVLDLGRMNRILEVNETLGYCVIEPGVTFYDLHDHLAKAGIALEFGFPNFGWGSAVGNALDRGFSFRGDHSSNICGLEVVLPDGSLLRTGNGAMAGGANWATARHGFGPSWDQAFVQANYGVVTKMGLWLHPVPEQVISVQVALEQPEDLGWFVDELSPLLLRGVLGGNIAVSTATNSVIDSSQRKDWYQGPGAIPDSVVARMMAERNLGWWNSTVRIAGHEDSNEANLKRVLAALRRHSAREYPVSRASGASQAAPRPGGQSTEGAELVRRSRRARGLLAGDARERRGSAGPVPAHQGALRRARHRPQLHFLSQRPHRHQHQPDADQPGRPGLHRAHRAAVRRAGVGRRLAGLCRIPHAPGLHG